MWILALKKLQSKLLLDFLLYVPRALPTNNWTIQNLVGILFYASWSNLSSIGHILTKLQIFNQNFHFIGWCGRVGKATSRRRRCRVQTPEKHKKCSKTILNIFGHIISSVHPTWWTRGDSSWFNREIVTARESCQVSWGRKLGMTSPFLFTKILKNRTLDIPIFIIEHKLW